MLVTRGTAAGGDGTSFAEHRHNQTVSKCESDEKLTMERTIRMDTGGMRTKVGNRGFDAPAEVVDVRFVRAKVDTSPLGSVSSDGEIGHHPRPE